MSQYHSLLEEKEYLLEKLYEAETAKQREFYEKQIEEVENKLNEF